ncbi:rhomboid protease [Malassezia vespertilionis]|uniref:Peptidase S54 rhomboid domain-containing protein n=1 Tax=Malassezia vespertilionis TaxID=2020962 RepID=A0A2N1J8J8_9BASI|nr:rhomboid protease [Malassezia vespertilionis]PKI82864.1 hypothetical protein MVES_003248 [Malassezia vespertilionis]WFD08315.1 rhomboid protease [Malassezia vespertilionis]
MLRRVLQRASLRAPPFVYIRVPRRIDPFRDGQYRGRSAPSGSQRVVIGLVAANTLVYGMWRYARDDATRMSDRRMYSFMVRNFTSGEYNLRQGRWWTLITACFSQQTLPHFAFNMLTFLFTAPAIVPLVGAQKLLHLYLGAGLVSSLTGIAWPYVIDPILGNDHHRMQRQASLSQGASGSVYAILAAFTALRPNATFYLFFAFPLPAWVCLSGILGWEMYAASYPPKDRHIDSVGHVGGLLSGLLFARFYLRRV